MSFSDGVISSKGRGNFHKNIFWVVNFSEGGISGESLVVKMSAGLFTENFPGVEIFSPQKCAVGNVCKGKLSGVGVRIPTQDYKSTPSSYDMSNSG